MGSAADAEVIGNEVPAGIDQMNRIVRQADNHRTAGLHRKLGHAGKWRLCKDEVCRDARPRKGRRTPQ